MALFSRKTKETGTDAPKKEVVRAIPMHGAVLQSPRITEKATFMSGVGAYVFDVTTDATKTQIKEAVQSVYNVKPEKIRIVNVRSKIVRNMRTGKRGVKQGGKKAYVYLKKGETITIA